MRLVISDYLTLADDIPQASHGNPVGLITITPATILCTAGTPILINSIWTTPASYVMNWLDSQQPTADQRHFASRFINPTYVTPPL